MIIPVLPRLDNRAAWLDFCRREASYCFIEQPECLVDFQSTFLKITLMPKQAAGHDAIKYSLGSRTSLEPVWQLIKGCNWNLNTIIQGLEKMEFGSNVRDNSLLKLHTDLSVRKYFSRERCVVPPDQLGLLSPLMAQPEVWDASSLHRLISNQQFQDLRREQRLLPGHNRRSYGGVEAPSVSEILMVLLNPHNRCIGQMHQERLHIFHNKQPFISLIPVLSWPEPRLKQAER